MKITACVQNLIDAFEALSPTERRKVVRELRGLCDGYEDGREEVWAELLLISNEKEQEKPYETLAATMTEAQILHHRSRAARAAVPKGWG